MIYLKNFIFPTEEMEVKFLYPPDSMLCDMEVKTHYGSVYPFNTLTEVGLRYVAFDTITIFYGGNGCGKTTALNVIAEKMKLKRDSLFNSGRFFSDYLKMCSYNEDDFERYGYLLNQNSRIITSDDVFNFSMEKRNFNKQLFKKTIDVTKKYYEICDGSPQLASLADYDRWQERKEAVKSKTAFLKKHLEREKEEHSNGETAMLYFIERMEDEGLYLLDEPENSLSLENQFKLAEYIESSAKYFNSQFVIATHSPIFLSLKGARIYNLDNNSKVVDSWTELPSVRQMYDFFMDHKAEFK
jgi:predicted ATPase